MGFSANMVVVGKKLGVIKEGTGRDVLRTILVYGYGNPGRQDDGLGPLLIEKIEELDLPYVQTDANYQLQIEDAADMIKHELVIYVDATLKGDSPFTVTRVEPLSGIAFTSHVVSPGSLLAICRDIYNKLPDTWMVGIRGYDFEFAEGLSERAQRNFEKALDFITLLLLEYKGRKMAEQKTILIIDDDADLRASMRIVLEASGFSIGEAADAEEGIKIAERIEPDAIIVDLMMETVDAGSKLSTHFKGTGFEGPIYLLSAAGDAVRYNIDARELGLAGIFQKPIDHKILINTLKKHLKVE
jgi:hydrogenase maturation protease